MSNPHSLTNGPVSWPSEELILVDEDDSAIGTASKEDCHLGDGRLHRAFSILLFNGAGELLLQQRAAEKPLWPLHWSNSCCSHPRANEEIEAAAHRRAQEELGVSATLRYIYKFRYRARYLDLGTEHEVCSVFLGRTDQAVVANPDEVAAWRYVHPEALDAELADEGAAFTPWFRMEWDRVRADLDTLLALTR